MAFQTKNVSLVNPVTHKLWEKTIFSVCFFPHLSWIVFSKEPLWLDSPCDVLLVFSLSLAPPLLIENIVNLYLSAIVRLLLLTSPSLHVLPSSEDIKTLWIKLNFDWNVPTTTGKLLLKEASKRRLRDWSSRMDRYPFKFHLGGWTFHKFNVISCFSKTS